jgi:hypothetical protein
MAVPGQLGQNESKILSQKYPAQKRAGRVALVVEHLSRGPEFKPQYCREKKVNK